MASVFLVGIAIVIGVMVIVWGTNISQNVMVGQDEKIAAAAVLKFSARYPSNVDCSSLCNVSQNPDIKCKSDYCYCVLIDNLEDRKVNYKVVTKGENGIDYCGPENFELNAHEAKIFAVGYDSTKVGTGKIKALIDPVLFLEN